MSLATARKKAREEAARRADGIDPREARRIEEVGCCRSHRHRPKLFELSRTLPD
ncbi:hypothetical protein ABL839_30275 [Variovorax atrisoli 110B]